MGRAQLEGEVGSEWGRRIGEGEAEAAGDALAHPCGCPLTTLVGGTQILAQGGKQKTQLQCCSGCGLN